MADNKKKSNYTGAAESADYSYFAQLLKPSDDERKYGPSIFETVQSMIKFSTSTAVEDAKSPALALRLYSQFMYYMMNSNLDTENMTTIAMPWLRPGFNVWADPTNSDKVYYLNAISFSGDPITGCTSQLSLSLGRERYTFMTNENYFGSQKDTCDNLLISQIFDSQSVDKFGTVLWNNEEYENLRESMFEFYNSDEEIISAEYSKYFQGLYGSVNHSPEVKTLTNISERIEEDEEKLTGKCNKAALSKTDQDNFNSNKNEEKRFLYWPFPLMKTDHVITNGYEKGVHNGIDVYCENIENVQSLCNGEVREVKKTADGYAVKIFTYSIDKDKCLYIYIAHLMSLSTKLEKYVDRKIDPRNSPSVRNNEVIGTCQGELHLAAELTDIEQKSTENVNILDYIMRTTGNNINYDSSFHNDEEKDADKSAEYYENGEQNSFSASKKFFRQEMSFEDIEQQIADIYKDAPAVIQNRCAALGERIKEADRFIQKYYECEDPPIWQDVKRIKEYANDTGYLKNEWVENLYDGDTPESLTVGIGRFSKRTGKSEIYTGSNGISIDEAIIAQEKEVTIPKSYSSYRFTYEWTRPRKKGKGWVRWSQNSKTGWKSNQAKIYDLWSVNKSNDRGIATYNGRYLVAVRPAIGSSGQYIDVQCTGKNGNVFTIKCIVWDVKATDRDADAYGHLYGDTLNPIEFHYIEDLYGTKPANPGTPSFFPEWQLGSVDKIIKYDKNILS